MNAKLILAGIVVAIVVAAIVGIIIFADEDENDWMWEFEADTWHEVTFTQEMFDCAGSDAPEDIFSEAVALGYEVCVFQYQNGNGKLVSWGNNLDPVYVTLHHITPGVKCNIQSDTDFTLVIQRC